MKGQVEMEQQQGAMSLDEFLGHRPNEGGGDTSFLRWNKRQPPAVNVWLHTRASILSLWQHGWPRLVERSDKATGARHWEVWGGQFNCWEAESTLRRQYFREKDTGLRKRPPTICPMCLFLEAIRQAVDAGQLNWVSPIFRFDVGSDSSRVLHAAGMYNGFKRNDLTPEELAEMKGAGIYRKEAWKENAMAKCQYVFRVVDNDAPQDGVQVSVEGTGLGDKVKTSIRDRMTARGNEAGNPLRSPYCIRWEHLPNEERLDARYRAIAMDLIALTPQIRQLIVDEQPPDISRLSAPGNPKKLRGVMEAHYCGPQGLIDWDAIFGPSEQAGGFDNDDADPADFPYGANAEEPGDVDEAVEAAAVAVPVAGVGSQVATQNAQPGAATGQQQALPTAGPVVAEEGDEVVACDECKKEMLLSQPKCPHCGFVYAEEQAPPPPPPPTRRSRAAATGKPPAKQATVAKAKPAGVAPPSSDKNADWGIGADDALDGIPF